MDELFAVVGLGNPGRRYVRTRHNVGYEVVALLAERWGASLKGGKGDYYVASCRYAEKAVILARPTTFMNLSGRATQGLASFYKIEIERLLPVMDDVNLPLGKIRLRQEGSGGGHKGLEDIIYQLGRDDFPRLRIGVGTEGMPDDLRGFVTERFTEDEQPVIQHAIVTAADAVEYFLREGIGEAMNRFN
jgi:PTH1 family peptidyl-tRNA hydrolase